MQSHGARQQVQRPPVSRRTRPPLGAHTTPKLTGREGSRLRADGVTLAPGGAEAPPATARLKPRPTAEWSRQTGDRRQQTVVGRDFRPAVRGGPSGPAAEGAVRGRRPLRRSPIRPWCRVRGTLPFHAARDSVRILVVTNDFPPKIGGANEYVARIVEPFPRGGIVVFASAWPGAAAFDRQFPHEVHRWPSRLMIPTPLVAARVFALVRRERPDLVLFGAAIPLASMGPLIRRRLRVPFATFTYGLEIAAARLPAGRALLRWIGRHAAFMTAVSPWTASALGRAAGSAAPVHLLPPGVDIERFHPGVSAQMVRERHGLEPGPVIACVSRLVPRKGQDQVIRSLPRIRADFPHVRFLVVGSGRDRRRLGALAHRLGVSAHVVFAGAVPHEDLPAYFRAGDVFAMPCQSRFCGLDIEGFGIVYLQAAAVGRPVVGGMSGGAPDAVQHNRTGLVVDGRDVAAVAGAISSLLADPARAARLGAAGAERVRREMTWDLAAARLREMVVAATKPCAVSPAACRASALRRPARRRPGSLSGPGEAAEPMSPAPSDGYPSGAQSCLRRFLPRVP